jgi:hypothetical protein
MATVKKTKPKKQVKKSKVFTWTPARKAAALALSTGLKTQRQVCKELNITEKTMCEWKKSHVFLEEIDRLTLKNELATRAGLLRECLKGLDLKRDHIEGDKNTHLHYVQTIADLQGLIKQKVDIEGNMNHTGGAVTIYIPDNGRDKKQDEDKDKS